MRSSDYMTVASVTEMLVHSTVHSIWCTRTGLHGGGTGVVLIDEVDKADMEFPNDLLHELDRMSFSVMETGDVHTAKAGSCHYHQQ